MFFTKDDYRRIEEWLSHRVTEKIALGNASIQGNGTGKSYGREVHIYSPDFYNVTLNAGKGYISLDEAVTLVPQDMRIFGLAITFLDEGGVWRIYQFAGLTFAQWDDITYWQSPYSADLEGLIPDVDNEDLCFVTQQGRKYIRLKDRQFSNLEFIDRGYQILRRNRIAVGDGWTNRLVNEMVCCPNTIYDLRYNYDLGGSTVKMPEGCVIDFNGGMLHNGTMELNGTGLLGVWELADMGDVSWTGTFKTGQVMTFLNEEASTLTGEFFVIAERESSSDEDGVDDTETYYAVNEEAWTTEERQELWWWNGEEWVKILDQTDYDTLYAIIEDVIEKIDYEMEACYAYFRTRIYNLECRVDECENQITNIWDDIENIHNDITNIENDITNIEGDITNIENDITNINNTINNLEEDFNTTINNFEETINNTINNLSEEITNVSNGAISSVTYTASVSSGTLLGTLKVDDTTYKIYAPESDDSSSGSDELGSEIATLVSYQAEVTSGTVIGYLVVNGEKTPIYVSSNGSSSDSDDDSDSDSSGSSGSGNSGGSSGCYWYLDSENNNLYAGTSTTASYAAYATAFYESSDVRLKRAIDDINKTDLKKVETVRLRQFIMGDDFKYGVIAQELEKAGLDNLVKINKDGYRSVDYIAFLILRIEALERKVKRYEQELLERSDQDAD